MGVLAKRENFVNHVDKNSQNIELLAYLTKSLIT